ncbi:MAG: oligopeptide/dipeptide ABC transporter ATP-binding protein [Acidobacteriota bacterium]
MAQAPAVAAGKTLLDVKDLRVSPRSTASCATRSAPCGRSTASRPDPRRGARSAGEWPSGKTTVGRAIMNLLSFITPEVELWGRDPLSAGNGTEPVNLNGLPRRAMFPYRAQISMIFQDPYSSLNPRMTVRQIIGGPLALHGNLDRPARETRVAELLACVGLQPEHAGRYPHEFSGGQRQRIGIARTLATRPRLVIADEPVSALDVSVRAQVINLMKELQAAFALTYLFIAHDLSILVHHVSDRIARMCPKPVEIAAATLPPPIRSTTVPGNSTASASAVPRPDPDADRSQRVHLAGDIPTPLAKPSGCGFRTRCPIAKPSCSAEVPPLQDVGEGHLVACPWT